MKKTLSQAEMLELWRQLKAVEPLRLDCSVCRTDGVDADAILAGRMRSWYLDLLDCGDERYLAPADVAAMASVSSGTCGITLVEAPADVRRVLRLRFAGWDGYVVPDTAPDVLRAAAANPFMRRPAAARLSPRLLAVGGAAGTLASLVCAVDHGPQVYSFDDSAIGLISECQL